MTTETGIAAEQLRSYIERIERLTDEKQGIADDIKEIYSEAKGTGFDVKAMRAVIKRRKMDRAERQNQDALIDLYGAAVGLE